TSVSDTASHGLAEDKSGPTIQEIVKGQGSKFVCSEYVCVPDEISQIQSVVKRWTEQENIDWIITTGGTGFGVRDITPEAIKPLVEREASGLVHLLLSASLKHTPFAALSRPIAGTIGKTLVVTLPGSVKAVKENMETLLNAGLVEHAVELTRGGTGQQVHDEMAKDSGEKSRGLYHHHHHHHHTPQPRSTLSHDPSGPGKDESILFAIEVSSRHRQSPYPLISMQEALQLIERNVHCLGIITRRVEYNLRGYVLAVDVSASQDVPRVPSTNVDGYAVRATDPPGVYKVLTSQIHSISQTVPPGSVFRVNTGGPLPIGSDAVIMVEDTRLVSTYKDSDGDLEGEEKEIEILIKVPEKENIRFPGTDVRVGDIVLQKGDIITSGGGEVGTLAFVGKKEVEVYRKPIVALLSTGNELIDLQNPVSHSGNDWGGIYDTNRPSLHAALEGMGYQVVDLGIVSDDVESHVAAIRRGLQSADILLTTGGTSMGPTDLLKPVIERHFNGTIHFGRVSVKPGKPTTFATIPYENSIKPVFALPGNPASALVTFYLFIVPALRLLGGWKKSQVQLPRVRVTLQSEIYLDPRTEYHRVIVSQGPNGLVATSTGGQRSSRVASLSGANGLAIVPPKTESSPLKLEVGSEVETVIIGEIQKLY
ncbi:Gephyrin, partial [Termitomyces sp. J132]